MPLPLALLAGTAARSVGTRAIGGAVARGAISEGAGASATGALNSGAGRLATHAAARYGVGAIHRGRQNRAQAQGQRQQDQGITQWARENPGEALVAGTYGAVNMLTSGSRLSDNAFNETNALLQSTQFTRTP
jgi:hypothetical protein